MPKHFVTGASISADFCANTARVFALLFSLLGQGSGNN